jgi:hypothetical protein
MSHTIVGKLNKPANSHQGEKGITFFVKLGVQTYNFKTKEKVWTNYDAPVFVSKEGQIAFYQSALIEGAIVSVSGSALIVENDENYGATLIMQDARIDYIHNSQPTQAAPMPMPAQNFQQPVQQPVQQGQPMQHAQPMQQVQQQVQQQQQAAQQFAHDDIPF